jgi:nicotinamidase-related amidase
MPLTRLETSAALVVIDLQKGTVGLPTVHPAEEIISRAAQLARAFRSRGLPVVLVHVTAPAPGRTDAGIPNFPRPADWTELAPELDQHPDDHVVTKQRGGAFLGTNLDDYLRQRGVTQVVLAGISTSAGVESTARSAYDLGYNVVLVQGCHDRPGRGSAPSKCREDFPPSGRDRHDRQGSGTVEQPLNRAALGAVSRKGGNKLPERKNLHDLP